MQITWQDVKVGDTIGVIFPDSRYNKDAYGVVSYVENGVAHIGGRIVPLYAAESIGRQDVAR